MASRKLSHFRPLSVRARRTVSVATGALFAGVHAACSSSAAAVPNTQVLADAAVPTTQDAGVTPTSACAALGLPASLTLGAGRGQTLTASLASVKDSATFEGAGGVSAWLEGEALHIRAGYTKEGSLTVHCGENDSTTIAVTTALPVWTKVSEWTGGDGAPLGREYFTFWQDQGDANRLFLFTGYLYYPKQYTASNDAWSFNLASKTWTSITPTGSIEPLAGSRVATAPGDRSALFYGGSQATSDGRIRTTPILKKITYDNSSWQIADAPKSSSAVSNYTGALVYDAKRARFLSVCGVNTDTRGLNCNVDAYTEAGGFVGVSTAPDAASGKRPAPRFGFHFAMDSANDRVVIFGGSSGTGGQEFSGDTWALDLAQTPARWVQLFGVTPEAEARRNGGWAHDPSANRMFVWGGTPDGSMSIGGVQVLALDKGHEQWLSIDPPGGPAPRTSGQMLYDAVGKRLIMGFGNGDAGVHTDLWQLALP